MWVTPDKQATVGKCLAQARTNAKVTQVELARRLGKAQSFVSSYEAGQRRIDLLEFLLIAEALKADPKQLFARVISARKPSTSRKCK